MAADKMKEEKARMQKDTADCRRLQTTADDCRPSFHFSHAESESQWAPNRMQEMEDLEAEYKAASDLFEKQKEEAMATMKKQEDLKMLS